MVFKRRDRRPIWKTLSDMFWPQKGWARPFHYVKHRLSRLPDDPRRIARGIFAGVFVSFSPFFGLHFVLAAVLAWFIRGNIVASLLATFVGNPVTFVIIPVLSLRTGYFLLGHAPPGQLGEGLFDLVSESVSTLYANLIAPFTGATADWHQLHIFYEEVFFPYMIGGVIMGAFFGLIAFYISLPFIKAYQNRRRKKLKAKWEEIKEKAALKADERAQSD